MLTSNDPIGSTLFPVARLMQLRAAEESLDCITHVAESMYNLLKAARRERDEAKKQRDALLSELDSLQCNIASAFGWDLHGVTFADAVRAVVRERDALKAIVARLPKTADGVSCQVGDRLWAIVHGRILVDTGDGAVWWCKHHVCRATMMGLFGYRNAAGAWLDFQVPVWECYSTRVAAERAKGDSNAT